MERHVILLAFFSFSFLLLNFQAHAAPAGPLVKHLSSLLKWTRSSTKTPQSDVNVVQFEDGYLVETVVEGNALGVVPYVIRVSQDGELFAVDEVNSNVVRITPPLSQYSRGRLVAGSFQGHTGHIDGKPSDARFNHPRGVTMDDNGNVYVADTANLAIRKIGEAGVTTIAGGKSNVAGYRDGPSEDAQFSNDFDLVYVQSTCSLLVIDRGNAALRQISLNQEDCDFQYNSISPSDIFMVIGAVLIGYASCILQLGFGHSLPKSKHHIEAESESDRHIKEEKQYPPRPIVENTKVEEEQEAPWPSLGQLIIDLSKLAVEATSGLILYLNPFKTMRKINLKPKGLTPLKDHLIMPEDQVAQKQKTPIPLAETRKADPNSEPTKPHKLRSSSFRDPSLSSKHRSKRQEYADLYGSNEVPSRSKSQKERTKHRQREKSGDTVLGTGVGGIDSNRVDSKPNHMNYEEAKFEHFNTRSKFGESYRF
ncbi:uncharacterized protein LOC124936132 [Impatiens glandulifera]|uniref:uncharacterized protein LOC124936132 n=1 Tax=Impatiens glandulifera TaxID=253017 RepID=UPI001FB09608|nr:uncharacterized protein LOC124936132 [Impatiens glandulifera]